ncbi:MAG: HPr family phosphocarrier protein [Planctomycetota bacterium]
MAWSPDMNTESPEPLCDASSGSLPEQTVSREVVVVNAAGLHARPADLLAREARKWRSRIELVNESQRADGKSILELLTLAAESGTRLVVEATGPDAREALEAIGGLFERRFNEHDDRQDS